MKAFYEKIREATDRLQVERNGYYAFLPHFHINLEILIVKKGKHKIFCNGEEFVVESGSIAFFDSYDVHGYYECKNVDRDDACLVIPFSFMEKYIKNKKSLKLQTPIIKDERLVEEVLFIVDKFLLDKRDESIQVSAIDMILSLIQQKLVYFENGVNGDTILVKKILEYIENNLKGDVRLKTIAKKLGYTEEHLSRTFNKSLKQSIPFYTNGLRLSYVENNLKRNGSNLTELIYEAGFKSPQTYYRARKARQKIV